MKTDLTGKRVAILVTNGFEQVELTKPQKALLDAGATTDIVSPEPKTVHAVQHDKPGDDFPVDVGLKDADANEYDALLLPGGVANPDSLRVNPDAVKFVKSFVDAGKPIAAICHGPWTLIEAGAARGRKMTSWPSLKTDLANAGATWVDEEVVMDRGIVTSRKPDDIPAFNRQMIEEFAEGKREYYTMPKSWSNKDERQYEHVKSSELKRGRSTKRAKEIAGATVNKTRHSQGRTKASR